MRYEPGTIEVVAYDEQGREVARTRQVTAGEPAALQLVADRTLLKADGDDMAFVTVSLTDKDGTFCPTADDELTFSVSGAGVYQAACNGDATSLEPFTEPQMRLFSGQLVVIVRTTKAPGDITLTVTNTKRGFERCLTLKSR